ncbi:MAG: endonuclease domain-containing protein [Candidatus Peribacteraceae bacterium]
MSSMLSNRIATPKKTIGRAKSLRRQQTLGERVLWEELRAKRFHQIKFRRQVPLGPFIVDFLCPERFLVIEIDGSSHDSEEAKRRDRRREAFLRKKGFSILRFGNDETLESTKNVLETIGERLGVIPGD